MPNVITQGAASAKGYGFGASSTAANYIEDVFSTYLYTGTGSAQTITNSIDLSTKGGMVWLKDRTQANPAWIMDTTRGTSSTLQPSSTGAAGSISTAITAFGTTGFTIGTNSNSNTNGNNYVSWTFRKQAKFFDVVTYTGTGANRTIAHNLGSVPGCIIVKRTDAVADWPVYHRGTGAGRFNWGKLNTTAAFSPESTIWNDTSPTSTVFSVGTATQVNANGGTYVAYLFAHDAGGFGASGSDNVISCGSFNTGGSGSVSVTLNYEPQWVMIKRTDSTSDWIMLDTMRGWANEETVSSNDMRLKANTSEAESADSLGFPSATGFQASGFGLNQTWIYIAIRRGPMKTPTSGTSVYNAIARTGNGTYSTYVSGAGFPVDLAWAFSRS